MKNPIVKFTMIAGLLLVAGVLTTAVVRAAEPDTEAKKARDLAKYDRNHNGKLDPDEQAALRADIYKKKAEKKPKGEKK